MRVLWLILLAASFSPVLFAQSEWPNPNWEKMNSLRCRDLDHTGSVSVGKYEVKLVPEANARPTSCAAYLIDSARHSTFLLKDWNISIHQGTGDDLFADRDSSLVLEGYSGGPHCCYTYEIVDLADRPTILAPISNRAPFFFFKDSRTKQFRIMTSDGDFDSFEGICRACAPFPRVVLQVNPAGLHDVSSQFVDQYDSEIALERAKIAEGDIGRFMMSDFEDAKAVVLEIALAYFYSGREPQAWQTLDEMWPSADRERVKDLILKIRRNGILSRLSQTGPRIRTAPLAP
jgi:hypothetical protein